MKILINTHVALWLFNDFENLSQAASDCLRDEKNELFISIAIASTWEIAIKYSLGKLPEFSGGVKRFLVQYTTVLFKSLVSRVNTLSALKNCRLFTATLLTELL